MSKAECKFRCRYTREREFWNASRTIIIREQFPSGDYPPHANEDQRVVLMLPEAPGREPVMKGLKKIPKNFVNLTWGYMRDFDFYKPYDAMIRQKVEETEWQRIQKVLTSKKKGAFIVFSNCKSDSKREDYIKELKKYFPVDTFGRCGDARCNEKCMKESLRDYHFYIAFENNVCEDYFSEKYFHIKDLVLPLVLKDEIYRGKVPANSYVAIDQYDSVQSLANYLQHLMHNSTAYLEHFWWAREYNLKKPSLWVPQYCKICENAHQKDFRKVYEDISEFFGPERRCDNDLVPRLLENQKKFNNTTTLSIKSYIELCNR
ncbi:Glyco-tran-10-N domain-containing protein [Aphelenchoides bicaudatus]|nr:Glyco-tran-10-N domain-containing protein [Aphelenchoides bicaudatus]